MRDASTTSSLRMEDVLAGLGSERAEGRVSSSIDVSVMVVVVAILVAMLGFVEM